MGNARAASSAECHSGVDVVIIYLFIKASVALFASSELQVSYKFSKRTKIPKSNKK